MTDSDGNCSTETESNAFFTAVNFDSIVNEAEGRQVLGQATAWKKKQRTEVSPRAVLPTSLHTTIAMMMDKHITKCLYGQDYDYNASLRGIGAALWRCRRIIS
jgi:hypothetical protein